MKRTDSGKDIPLATVILGIRGEAVTPNPAGKENA